MHQTLSFTTIAAIREWKFVGNAFADGPAFDAIDAFVLDTKNSMADRAEALRLMARNAMSLDGEDAGDHLSDEELVAERLSIEE